MELFITIESGHILNKTGFAKALFKLRDGRYLLKIERKNKRTNGQNRYIHGVLFPELKNAFNEAGWDEIRTMEMAKEIAKRRFLTTQIVNEKTGEVMEFVKETSQLSTIEMNVFIDDVIKFAAENLNYQIMYPNEQASLYE